MRATIVGNKGQGGLMKAMSKSAGSRGGPNPQQMAQMQQHVSLWSGEAAENERGGERRSRGRRKEEKNPQRTTLNTFLSLNKPPKNTNQPTNNSWERCSLLRRSSRWEGPGRCRAFSRRSRGPQGWEEEEARAAAGRLGEEKKVE